MRDACGSEGNLAGNERFATAFTFVIEQDTVNGKHTVAFAIVFGDPETILLGYSVRRTGIERGGFLLRNFLHLAEKFGGGSLIDARFLFQSQDAYGFEHTQRTDGIRFSCIFGHVERNLYVTLCGQIVDLIRLYLLYDADQ